MRVWLKVEVLRSVVFAVVFVVVACAHGQTVIYVDDDAPLGGDGMSWATAYKYLQDALHDGAALPPPVTIKVGQGTYKPDRDEAGNVTPGDREASFVLFDGLTLSGGYAGFGAVNPDVQDHELHQSTLTGDLKGNDGSDFQNYDENSYGVWRVSASKNGGSLVMEALVTRGNAGWPIAKASREPQLGSSEGTEPYTFVFRDCEFVANNSNSRAVLNFHNSHIVFEDCEFQQNRGNRPDPPYCTGGGAIYQVGGSAVFRGCIFRQNEAIGQGGAAYTARNVSGCWGSLEPISFVGCQFIGNRGTIGGAVSLWSCEFDVEFLNCHFDSNVATSGYGGALSMLQLRASLKNCVFTNNLALGENSYGGGFEWREWEECDYNETYLQLENCYFAGNVATHGSAGATLYAKWYNSFQHRLLVSGPGLFGEGELFVGGSRLSLEPSAANKPGVVESDLSIQMEEYDPFGKKDMWPYPNPPALDINFLQNSETTGHDRLDCSSAVQVTGRLTVNALNELQLKTVDCFEIVTGKSVTGHFDIAFLPDLPGDLYMTVNYNQPCNGLRGEDGSDTVSLSVQSLSSLLLFGDTGAGAIVDGTPTAVVTGDFDPQNNNGLDLAVTLTGDPGHVVIFFNNGSGDFITGPLYAVGNQPSSLVAADFDGDNDLDIAVANSAGHSYRILSNNGDGTLVAKDAIPIGSQPGSLPADIDAGHFNNDTFPDLVVSLFGDDGIFVLLNDGNGGFPMSTITPVGDEPDDVDPIDIDDDKKGWVDIALVRRGNPQLGGDAITILRGNGDGTFDTDNRIDISGLVDPTELVASDLTGDGLPELIVTNTSENGSVAVLVNQGDGAFTPPANLPVGTFPGSIAAVDLDEDDDTDIAVVVSDPDTNEPVVRTIRNDTPGPGQPLALVLNNNNLGEGDNPKLVINGDVDADGDDDLITLNSGGSQRGAEESTTLLVLPNLHCRADIAGGDGEIDDADLQRLLSNWNTAGAGADLAEPENSVNVNDLFVLLAAWGDCR